MTLRVLIAIDAGQTGALAVLADGQWDRFVDMPVMPRPAGGNEINAAALAEHFREIRRSHPGATFAIVLEQVGAMPKQGVTSVWKFAEGFGVIKGVIGALGIPMILVHPARWKKVTGLTGKEKDCARTLAIQRYPAASHQLARKKDIGRADALMIAHWAVSSGTEVPSTTLQEAG